MPLTKPYLDMVDAENIPVATDSDASTAVNKLVVYKEGEYSLENTPVNDTSAKIVDVVYDMQLGVLSLLFTNGKTLKATGFPTIAKLSKGREGDQGDKGRDGRSDVDGKDGEKGTTGCSGDDGPQGSVGDRGPKGDQGDDGERGDKGLQGDIGHQGKRGDRGLIAAPGPKGDQGDPGDDGKVNVIISNTDPGDSIGPLGIWIRPGLEVTESNTDPIPVTPVYVTPKTEQVTTQPPSLTTSRTTPVPITSSTTTVTTASTASTATTATTGNKVQKVCGYASGVKADEVCASGNSQNSDGPTNGDTSVIPWNAGASASGKVLFGQEFKMSLTSIPSSIGDAAVITAITLTVVAKRGGSTNATFEGFDLFSQGDVVNPFMKARASRTINTGMSELSVSGSPTKNLTLGAFKTSHSFISKFTRSSMVSSVSYDPATGIMIDSYQICLTVEETV